MGTTLISWLGRTDLRAVTEAGQVGLGPAAQALQTGRFARLELLSDYSPEDAAAYLAWLQTQAPTPVTPRHVTLANPTDFGAIDRHARAVVAATSAAQPPGDSLAFDLSPGTPAMAAVWIILAKTRFPAELIESSIRHGVRTASVPFVTINCGAIAPDLIEPELFGHEKGAFTGAVGQRQGYFKSAHLGTLLLDELGELPKPAQVKLLRALEEGEVTRVGATAPTPVDVRILAATNRTLVDEVAAGRFREDLFYRLAVAVIHLPPLREREGDAGLLLDRLLDQVNRESESEPGCSPKILSVNARKRLLEHAWPGNVREMQNTLRPDRKMGRRLDPRPDHRPGRRPRRPAAEPDARPCERPGPGAGYRPRD